MEAEEKLQGVREGREDVELSEGDVVLHKHQYAVYLDKDSQDNLHLLESYWTTEGTIPREFWVSNPNHRMIHRDHGDNIRIGGGKKYDVREVEESDERFSKYVGFLEKGGLWN